MSGKTLKYTSEDPTVYAIKLQFEALSSQMYQYSKSRKSYPKPKCTTKLYLVYSTVHIVPASFKAINLIRKLYIAVPLR